MWPTTWRSETSTRPRLQSTRLRSGREPRPGPGRRTRPRGKQGWALSQQGLVQPCSLCSFLVEPWKADSGYCFAVIPRGWGVLGVRWAAAEAPRCQQALRGPEATEPWSLGWAEPAAEPSPPPVIMYPPLQLQWFLSQGFWTYWDRQSNSREAEQLRAGTGSGGSAQAQALLLLPLEQGQAGPGAQTHSTTTVKAMAVGAVAS